MYLLRRAVVLLFAMPLALRLAGHARAAALPLTCVGRNGSLRRRRMRRAQWLLSTSAVVLLAMTPSWATANTFPFGVFGVSATPTLVVSDAVSGAAIGPAAAASGITQAANYTFNIDAVPPSFFLVDGASKPIQIAFHDFTGFDFGAPVTVSNLVVELRVGGGDTCRPVTVSSISLSRSSRRRSQ